jgi:hypothetical protein
MVEEPASPFFLPKSLHMSASFIAKRLERFRAKWLPVRVKKTRQNNK